MRVLKVKTGDKYWKDFDEVGLIDPKTESNGRGFSGLEFKDRYRQECVLKNSSLATEGAIWFGVDTTGPQLDGPSGKRNEEVQVYMHLTRRQIEQLLPLFHEFVEIGYITEETLAKVSKGEK